MRAQQGGHLRSAHKVTRSTRLHLYSKPRCSFRKMFAFYRNLLHLLHRSCSGCEVQPQHVRYNHRQKLFITISILADSCGPLLLQRALKKKANLKKLFFVPLKRISRCFHTFPKGIFKKNLLNLLKVYYFNFEFVDPMIASFSHSSPQQNDT